MVICDFLRSEDAGFLIEDECLAAMTTRAQALTILAGRESVLRGKGARTLMNLHEYLKTHNTFNRLTLCPLLVIIDEAGR
ncbi:hypothetical protein LI328DRAFT_158133 [Trichoderma asperelloides]|nr:hypothetical protein LI328DRAFT_158133 [Trichoderma asperelloides]